MIDPVIDSVFRTNNGKLPNGGSDRAELATQLAWAGDQIISLLSGPLAEQLFCAEQLPSTEHDELEARCLAEVVCRSTSAVDAYLADARAEAIALLRDHRDVVLGIAAALIRHRDR